MLNTLFIEEFKNDDQRTKRSRETRGKLKGIKKGKLLIPADMYACILVDI